MDNGKGKWYNISDLGGIAQPVRALASHARGPRFEPVCLHQNMRKADNHADYRLFSFYRNVPCRSAAGFIATP